MNKRTWLTLISGATILSGCAGSLQTSPYRQRTEDRAGALRGVTYALPMVQYQLKLRRWLAECPGTDPDGKTTALKFGVEVTGEKEYVPGEAYNVDYERLAGFLRTSSFEIKYWPNGTLKSIGASAEDHTADAIKDTVKTVLSVASAAASMGVMLAGPVSQNGGDGEAMAVCSAAAAQQVDELRRLNAALKEKTKKLELLRKDLERIQTQAAVRLVRTADRQRLLTLFDDLRDHEAQIAAANERINALKEALSIDETLQWNSAVGGDLVQSRSYALSAEQAGKLAAMLTAGHGPKLDPGSEEARQDAKRRALAPACFGGEINLVNCVKQNLDLTSAVHFPSPLPACPAGGAGTGASECLESVRSADARYRNARDGTPDAGIFVREPVQARLLFCRKARLSAGKTCSPAEDEGKLDAAYFPQFGQLRYLPLRVGTFQAREMALSLTEEGKIESFTYKSTKAPGQVLAATAADVAGQIDAAFEKRETERRSDAEYAAQQANADIQAEITRLTKEAELKKLKDPPQADPLKPVRDETAALEVQTALLKAKLAQRLAEQALAAQP
ncbi:MAG: hypothetical protein JOZ90_13160 [Alphaproteobacteria bacterium]|nr:hypothetical protein [Alphaproteobacteria bacterium]MBV9370321.1 hypothetical protein [Alphaproteobacteria bacterium]MBV9902022.1 hypothetical protein [Alphaproteobacteria bacterium]